MSAKLPHLRDEQSKFQKMKSLSEVFVMVKPHDCLLHIVSYLLYYWKHCQHRTWRMRFRKGTFVSKKWTQWVSSDDLSQGVCSSWINQVVCTWQSMATGSPERKNKQKLWWLGTEGSLEGKEENMKEEKKEEVGKHKTSVPLTDLSILLSETFLWCSRKNRDLEVGAEFEILLHQMQDITWKT